MLMSGLEISSNNFL